MNRRQDNGRKGKLMLAAAVLTGLGASLAQAATTPRTWDGLTSGAQDWNTASNWSDDNVPDIDGTNGETATISDVLTGARTISGTINIEGLTWTSDTSTSSDTLKLTADALVRQVMTISNTGAVSNKVLDLNGHEFRMSSGTSMAAGNTGSFTIRNSGGAGGVLAVRGFGTTTATIESGVTVRPTSPTTSGMGNITMEDGSIYHVDAGVDFILSGGPANGFWDFIVDSGAAKHQAHDRVRNDVVINGGAIGFRNVRTLSVGGDFTDAVTTGDYSYQDAGSSGTVIFDGGASTVRNVSIARTGITKVGFQVGNATTDGNVKLGHDLITGAGFKVTDGSIADLDDYSVTAATVGIDSGALLGYTFADADSGLIAAGALTLNDFSLDLSLGGGWTSGNDLLLMTYTSLSGTPNLVNVTLPAGGTHGGLFVDPTNKQILLTNVSVPEPAFLSAGALAMLVLTRRPRRVRGSSV